MSQENQNEEIDLMQLFGMIKDFFRKFLRLVIDVVLFFRKKIVLFLVLGLIGAALGFFMDKYMDKKNDFVQEIIIEPNYDSVEYIYDFVNDLEYNLSDDNYVNKLGLEIEQIKNVKKITLEPIIQPYDVLSRLENKESFVDEYSEKSLKEKKFRNFYLRHKLTIQFNNGNVENTKIIDKILAFLKTNEYYNQLLSFQLKQTRKNLEQSEISLKFINDYLTNLSNNPGQDEDKFVFATESETPTISSLLKRKESLIIGIGQQERILELNKEMYTLVEYGDIISKRKKLVKRNMFIMPLILIGLISALYFMKYLFVAINSFIDKD